MLNNLRPRTAHRRSIAIRNAIRPFALESKRTTTSVDVVADATTNYGCSKHSNIINCPPLQAHSVRSCTEFAKHHSPFASSPTHKRRHTRRERACEEMAKCSDALRVQQEEIMDRRQNNKNQVRFVKWKSYNSLSAETNLKFYAINIFFIFIIRSVHNFFRGGECSFLCHGELCANRNAFAERRKNCNLARKRQMRRA